MKHVLAAAAILAVTISSAEAATNVHQLVVDSAHRNGVSVTIALKVVQHESGFNCRALGRAGELGPLQIKYATAKGLGYRGPKSALRSCGAGLEWGMKHLALAIRSGGVWKHNQGLAAKVENAMARAYERAVMQTRIIAAADTAPFLGVSELKVGTRAR